jgi:hypothetical protein
MMAPTDRETLSQLPLRSPSSFNAVAAAVVASSPYHEPPESTTVSTSGNA